MFPQVAQQSHHLPEFPQSTDIISYESPEQPQYYAQSHQRPYRTVESFSRPRVGSFQHAMPVQHSFRSPSSFTQISQNDGSPNPEHLLRRKTPNGTLAAGYDGTPVRWSTKPPASKHILLPSSSLSVSRSARSGGSHLPIPGESVGLNGMQSPLYTASMQDSITAQAARYSPVHGPYSESHWQGQSMMQTPATGSDWPLPDPSSGPFLDHLLVQQQPIDFWGNSTQVPTVLQPTYQLGPGPTASNSSSHYGPYWPDGTFTPYRPAALASQHSAYNGGSMYPMDSRTFRQMTYPSRPRTSTLSSHNFGGTSHSSHRAEGDFYGSTPGGFHTPVYPNANLRGQAQFKEKMLAWAHSVYVDLLAYLHQNKKRSDPTKRHHSRTTLYPKPPRQPLLNFDAEHNGSHHMHAGHSGGFPSSCNAPFMTPFSRIPSAHDQGQPQLSNARAALEMVENLCEESHWSWIEGMLLGGCLAYGLEEFTKALNWYTKIISIDQSHVEAMSNLAATLLALNRRQEAEQHWLQSVRLRPSYFEAVEHLIGVLCDDHRGREAVDVIEFVERALLATKSDSFRNIDDLVSESSSDRRSSCDSSQDSSDHQAFDHDMYQGFGSPPVKPQRESQGQSGFGSSGFSIPGSDNGRMLALVHAKGNMLYALGDIPGASKAFEDAVLISIGRAMHGVQELISRIHRVLSVESGVPNAHGHAPLEPLLLSPDMALQTSKLVFAKHGELPGLQHVPLGMPRRAAISTTSNSLLSLAKIFQDGMSSTSVPHTGPGTQSSVADILALYYLSLSLQPSPSTANNVGILLAGIQQSSLHKSTALKGQQDLPKLPGVVPGSGIALALAYYNYGLILDSRHAHLYTNLGSLLKDIGHLDSAIAMYEQAVNCDATFDIALANLANAVKDKGRVSDAIQYYKRAVAASPDFAEAVCGLANALNSVCDWAGRGGVYLDDGRHDRWHVGEKGEMIDATVRKTSSAGWINRVVEIVQRQLVEGAKWGLGTLNERNLVGFLQQIEHAEVGPGSQWSAIEKEAAQAKLATWMGSDWEGARITKLIERTTRKTMQRWYQDKYVRHRNRPPTNYPRIRLPNSISVPGAPTVLPFHTFTYPLSAKEIRMISQRNALRISCSTLKSPWLPQSVFMPPPPPSPQLNIGYVSSDFNNHPLSHLMQSVFGLHNPDRVKAFCYATTASDRSIHRQQIEREAAVFRDASSWPAEKLVHQILQDGIHILVNLNGYTRGARNEVFAARPAPIQMSFMGYAGTTGAEWCDYLLADELTIPPETLRPNIEFQESVLDTPSSVHEEDNWVYSEKIIFSRNSFFCTDHKQSSRDRQIPWESEKIRRWKMRKNLFPALDDNTIILGNFNQLYKIDPTTFRTWLRILAKVPSAVLWLLRFPDLGESNLRACAKLWAGEEVAARIIFTSVAAKEDHISRACVIDLFLDTPECNAHTTATDVLWSGSPILTLPRYKYKMCSRMASSILKSALPKTKEGTEAASQLITEDERGYENMAISLAEDMKYYGGGDGSGKLLEIRKLLYEHRSHCALFDTKQWVGALEDAYEIAWRNWVDDDEGDIYL